MTSPNGYPIVSITGTEDEVMDFLTAYCGGDVEMALDFFEGAVAVGDGRVTVGDLDWVVEDRV